MPNESWDPPPGQHDRDPRADAAERERLRKLETRAREADADYDIREETEEINFHGSER
jgi:hypothetical protein